MEKVIDDTTYRCAPLNAVEGLTLGLEVVKILGPGVKNIMSVLGDDGAEGALSILSDILKEADPVAVTDLVQRVVEMAQVQSSDGQYMEVIAGHHFESDLLGMLKVVLFVLEVNFADFFNAAKRSPLLVKATAAASAKLK